MFKKTVLLLSIAFVIVQVSAAQNTLPLAEAKHLVEEMYPELSSRELHATYKLEQDNFSTPGIPQQLQLRIDEYCYPKLEPKTRRSPVPPRYLCAEVDSSYQPKLAIGFFFIKMQQGMFLEEFHTDGTIFQKRITSGSDLSTALGFGPDKEAQVVARIPLKTLEKLLGTRLAVTRAHFFAEQNVWLVDLKGNGRFLLTVEPVAGLITGLQTLTSPVFKKRSQK